MNTEYRMQRDSDLFPPYLALRTLAGRPLLCSQETENSPMGSLTSERGIKTVKIQITGNSATNDPPSSPGW